MVVIVGVGGGTARVAQLHLQRRVNDGIDLQNGEEQRRRADEDRKQLSGEGTLNGGFHSVEGFLDGCGRLLFSRNIKHPKT